MHVMKIVNILVVISLLVGLSGCVSQTPNQKRYKALKKIKPESVQQVDVSTDSVFSPTSFTTTNRAVIDSLCNACSLSGSYTYPKLNNEPRRTTVCNITITFKDGAKQSILAVWSPRSSAVTCFFVPDKATYVGENQCFANPALYDWLVANITALSVKKLTDSDFKEFSDFESPSFPMEYLDASDCLGLRTLKSERGEAKGVNVSGCSNLAYFLWINQRLLDVNISGCASLQTFGCYNNQLTSLNMSGYTNLTLLWCNQNQLTNLDVSGSARLQDLNCSRNQLTALNLISSTNLTKLVCSGNRLTNSLNLSFNRNLAYVDATSNNLSEIVLWNTNSPPATLRYDVGVTIRQGN